MFYKESLGRKIFVIWNYFFLLTSVFICIVPFINVLAVSFSSSVAISAGEVKLWPVGFNLQPYQFVLEDSRFYKAFIVSVERVALGIIISMFLVALAAYPLSKSSRVFKARQFYVWLFIVSILFQGGLIPTYLVVRNAGLIDSIWALVIPNAVPVFSVILLQNYFKSIPDEISESAFIDGASHFYILFRILLPLSKPILATLVLFTAVGHWNSWFDGILYMNKPENYPLQSYLQTVVVQNNLGLLTDIKELENVSPENSKTAQIILTMLPILAFYPFLQKYFTKGIMLGSVKG